MFTSRVIESNTTVLGAGSSNDDNPEMVTMRPELDEPRELSASVVTTTPVTTAGAVYTGKRARVHKNGKTTVPKVVITCTVSKKY
jgi:hypothetical protein